MAHLSQPSYLLLRGRNYYFRIMVPRQLLPVFKRQEYKKSLRTGDYKAAFRLGQKYALFAETYFEYIQAMHPSSEDICFLIRNHFEKCLMEAEERTWLAHSAKEEGSETVDDLRASLEQLRANHQKLKDIAFEDEYGPYQEKVAKELLEWQGFELSHLDELYRQLVRGIMSAQLEAARLHIAHFLNDGEDTNIRPDLFKNCHNYLINYDSERYLAYAHKPYHGDLPKKPVLALTEAVDLYFENKKRETKDWHLVNRSYLARAMDILGKDTPLNQLSKKDGFTLEDALWEIPANYKKHYADVPLAEFLEGNRGEYEKISAPTVSNYWQSIKAFFEWCENREYISVNILAGIKLNKRRSGLEEQGRRSFTSEELKALFSCPLYTGHKYENREFWLPGEFLTKNGYYWIPLVGLFAGLRLGEILYLQIKDIRSEDGVLYIDVNKDEGKSLKNKQSARKIPIHPVLKEIGFVDYYETRKADSKEESRLFDGITFPENGKIIKNFSRNFANLITNIGIKKDAQLSFHSLRHNYVDALRRAAGNAPEIMDPLDGRATVKQARGSRGGYGHDFTPSELYPYVEKMDFKVDFSALFPKLR